MNRSEFEKQFCKDMGIDDEGRKCGVRVRYDVAELMEKQGYRYNRVPSGRFQIKIYTPWCRPGHQIFRTSKKDNSYRIEDALDTLDYQVSYYKNQAATTATRVSNLELANNLIKKFDGPHVYISSYVPSHAGTFCAPSERTEGKLCVGIYCGEVTPEQADRILEFFTQIKKENA